MCIRDSLYVESVQELGFCPKKMRMDLGTENGIMADMHCYLVNDMNAHSYGTSVANQRIENWWSSLKRGYTAWVIQFFKDLIEENILVVGHQVHMECVWFVFSKFLQNQLDEVQYEWNTHYIRKSRNDTIPGIPDVNFHSPPDGYKNEQIEIDNDNIEQLLNERNILDEARALESEQGDENLSDYFRYVVDSEDLPS